MSEENILSGAQHETEKSEPSGLFDILSRLGNMQNSAPSSPEKPAGTGDGALFSSLLSNPELLSKLPELISVVSPLISSLSLGGNPAAPTAAQNQTKPAGSFLPAQSREVQNSNALLCALKPYLKKERQDAIDYMIKLSRLGDILKTL